jgi:hypothetical protein
MRKKFIWAGVILGSSIGGMVPLMWGDDMLSIWGIVMSLAGGLVGIWAGYRVSESL